MKKLLVRLIFFLLPFIVLTIMYPLIYSKTEGDLCRLGKISIKSNYRDVFFDSSALHKRWKNFSDLNLNTESKIDILTIGDSFSSFGYYGYQNYLAISSDLKVVNFNPTGYALNKYNPIEFLNQIINGNLLDSINVDYVIIQGVERYLIDYNNNTDFNSSLSIEDLNSKRRVNSKYDYSKKISVSEYLYNVKAFYFNSLQYIISDKAYFSSVYKMEIIQPLFTVRENELLFINEDLHSINKISEHSVSKINDSLNVLSKKLDNLNVKLIFMVCPDKYDLYYDFIKDNPYSKNPFFEHFNLLSKNYIYIDVKKILKAELDAGERDIYYADDTHWSPKGNKIIAKYISGLIAN